MVNNERDKMDLYVEIFNTYQSKIYHIAYSVLGNDYDANDVVQDTVMRAVDKIDQLKNKNKLEIWIYTIAYNFAKLKYNQNKKNIKVEQYCIDKLKYNELLSIPDNLIKEEARMFILDKVKCLNPKYGEVIYLYFYKNFSYKEISQELKISIGTVKSRLFRGKSSLRKMLSIDNNFDSKKWNNENNNNIKKLKGM
ncbi:RNA polymerase sigma factor [Abyssisolibacter fermentans]|uniref:RNA polymerase sigma factor n=1 Tax=Abyssisolibacter fermentans TaxID=1766203 RepID=UPI000835CC4D|nr:RNA polymerase sigma factor [Abyssisolibacter fermentans]